MPVSLAERLLRQSRRGCQERAEKVTEDPDEGHCADSDARRGFYLFTALQFHSLLQQVLRALPAKTDEQEHFTELLDELRNDLEEYEGDHNRGEKYYETRLSDGLRRLSIFIEEQRKAVLHREQELRDVLAILTQNMADATSENAELYENIRAEKARIEEASRHDDLRRLQYVLREVTERLSSLVANKESLDQSRVDALSKQVQVLEGELSEMRRQADIDPLTQQLNRRCFDEILSALVMRCSGTRRSFALIIFDLDDFKAINDHYGHHVGDRALIAFAHYCRRQLRSKDSFARIGGEEFAVLLEDASLRSGIKRAEKICAGIAALRYAVDDNSDAVLSLSVSAGVAAFRRNDSALSLFQRADAALYKAKAEGKNCARAG